MFSAADKGQYRWRIDSKCCEGMQKVASFEHKALCLLVNKWVSFLQKNLSLKMKRANMFKQFWLFKAQRRLWQNQDV